MIMTAISWVAATASRSSACRMARDLAGVQQPVDPGQQLDEHTELRGTHGAPADHLALAQTARHGRPRVTLQRLEAQRELALGLVDPDDLDRHRLAHAELVTGPCRARVRELGHRHQALDTAQIDEGAEVGQRADRAGQHRVDDDLLARLLGRLGRLLFQDASPRKHDVAAVFLEPRDAELEHPADVVLLGFDPAQVHLRERAEGAQAADRDLVAALDDGRDLAVHRQAALRRHRQRLASLGALAQLVGQTDLVTGGDDGGFHLVADGDLQAALVVGELGAVDPRLALAAHVHEDVLGGDLDDPALDDLAALERGAGFVGSEQRGEVFGFGHGAHNYTDPCHGDPPAGPPVDDSRVPPGGFPHAGQRCVRDISIFAAMVYVDTRHARALWTAIALLPLGLVLDVLDGRVARWRQRHSAMGRELDSLADVISFGVAPAALAYAAGLRGAWDVVVLVYFVCCGVSRLARFNVTAEELSGAAGKVKYFEGTPIPSSLLLVAVVAVCAWLGRLGDDAPLGALHLGLGRLHPLALLWAISGSLMISKTLRIPKL
jgi:CDP-diacylglycerol--serine O-phosphatidyltransferase